MGEHRTGRIHVFETATSAHLTTIETGHTATGGMAVSPNAGELHYVDADTNTLYAVRRQDECASSSSTYSAANPLFADAVAAATAEVDAASGPGTFSLTKDYSCRADPVIPDSSLFDQVHADTGYAQFGLKYQHVLLYL